LEVNHGDRSSTFTLDLVGASDQGRMGLQDGLDEATDAAAQADPHPYRHEDQELVIAEYTGL
jgi:hypothetical protein